MRTLREIKARTEPFLAERGIPNYVLETDLMIAHALGLKRLDLYLDLDRPITEAQLDDLRAWVKRRAAREPLQYILGSVDFAGLKLAVDTRALIPRPETEELAYYLGRRLEATPPARILDLGTGSGALALALAQDFPDAEVTATDASKKALDLARENAKGNDLAERICFLEGSWWEALPAEQSYDLIVSNPPYLTEAEMESAAPEVAAHEPRSALVAGADGLQDLRILLVGAASYLARGGLLALETGIAQEAALHNLAEENGLQGEALEDLNQRPRFFLAQVQA
ncbi:MAG: Release factor glutamine methyltransferase [Opitutia bacterium UBA7350]|nr:MAG: Release factor glutamine methyltransferase [Opitutae bacterium UBA7350]